MAFIQATASMRKRSTEVLSADNTFPERHIVIETLRKAAPLLGLKAPVIATLDAMLSCLPPKRNHNTVFASNATLAFRRNGISDRTIRRHAATLQEMGFLVRKDSANKKRFTRHNQAEGMALRFGFDLSPIFARFQEVAALAAQATQNCEQIAYLRAKIRAAANSALSHDPHDTLATTTLRMLRRKLSLSDLQDLQIALSKTEVSSAESPLDATEMAAKDGQNVRHHHRSSKEHIEKEEPQRTNKHDQQTSLSISHLVEACPEAAQFALDKIETENDIINHARTLAPMIGIDERTYNLAQQRIGSLGAALTVWGIMQFHNKIKSVGAYFRALTSGHKSDGFDPSELIKRLSKRQGQTV